MFYIFIPFIITLSLMAMIFLIAKFYDYINPKYHETYELYNTDKIEAFDYTKVKSCNWLDEVSQFIGESYENVISISSFEFCEFYDDELACITDYPAEIFYGIAVEYAYKFGSYGTQTYLLVFKKEHVLGEYQIKQNELLRKRISSALNKLVIEPYSAKYNVKTNQFVLSISE